MDNQTHDCGGAILSGSLGFDDQPNYLYCDRCGAFRHGEKAGEGPDSIPSGTDAEVNRIAWDDSEEQSPAPE